MRRTLRAGLLAVALGCAGLATVAWLAVRSLDEPLVVGNGLRFKVPAGASFSRVAADLHARGILASPRAWAWYARRGGEAGAIKAGEYLLDPGLTPRGLLGRMVRGEVVFFTFTIVDGWRVQDMLDALRRNPDVVHTLQVTGPAELLQAIGETPGPAEGQFLPETYRFESDTTDIELLRRAHQGLVQELATDWLGRDADNPLKSPGELLIMASIVEKETAAPAELARVAGLYLHRLAIGMRLQADPTVIYGVGEAYDGELHTVDLRTDGPYNTYTRAGLPPTPISLPGAAALRAAANPEKTEALYFVASDRDDGTHVFSATLQQQNAAVARYVAHRRAQAGAAGRLP